MKYLFYTILTAILIFPLNCDEDAFLNMSLINLKIKEIFPPQPDNETQVKTPRNSSIVATFNKNIDEKKFRETMLKVVTTDGDKLDGEIAIQGKTIIFTPSKEILMKAETTYKINIADLKDTDGNTLKRAFQSFFETGKSENIDDKEPCVVEIKTVENKIQVYFNEALLVHRLKPDAVTVYNVTKSKPVYGKATGSNFSNIITFTADRQLELNNKYRVTVHIKKGIIDLANNEFKEQNNDYYIFASAKYDNTPPFVKYITTDHAIKKITIFFTERIDILHTLKEEYNRVLPGVQMDKCGMLISRTKVPPPAFCTRGISYPINTCASIQVFPDTVTFGDDHSSMTLNIDDESQLDQTLTVYVKKEAIRDLNGNTLTHFGDPLAEDEQYIRFTCHP